MAQEEKRRQREAASKAEDEEAQRRKEEREREREKRRQEREELVNAPITTTGTPHATETEVRQDGLDENRKAEMRKLRFSGSGGF